MKLTIIHFENAIKILIKNKTKFNLVFNYEAKEQTIRNKTKIIIKISNH